MYKRGFSINSFGGFSATRKNVQRGVVGKKRGVWCGIIRLGKDVVVEVVGAVVVMVVAQRAGLYGDCGAQMGPALHRPAESAETTTAGLK